MLTVDTSGVLALLDRRDPDHERLKAVVSEDPGPFLVPAGILAEIAYFVERWKGAEALDAFLADLEAGEFSIDCGEGEMPRIRHLVRRYADLPLGFADASVIACAERSGGRVLTLDVRDFGVVAREGTIEIVPGSS